jgi:hypothetical protein
MALLDMFQDGQSVLSLVGNGFNTNPGQQGWGFPDFSGELAPDLSRLHDNYSVDGDPNVTIQDFNRLALGGVTATQSPSTLNEMDPIAPNNFQAGLGGVVSQIYKSVSGRTYRDLGPQPGRY